MTKEREIIHSSTVYDIISVVQQFLEVSRSQSF